MIITRVAIGNEKEAFIEDRFKENINVISSDDNNRGKTILIQGMFYALGNSPVFPSTFIFREYFYVVDFQYNGTDYSICREKDLFILRHNNKLIILDSVSDLKRYWNKNIFTLPAIRKNSSSRIVDPELFWQMSFTGQDKKDTSNLNNKGFYNKEDFLQMLYSYSGIPTMQETSFDNESLKKQLQNLKNEKSILLKQAKILKSKSTPVEFLSSVNDRERFKTNIENLEKIKETLIQYKTLRNRYLNRKTKCEITLKELLSLNREIEMGELVCLDCGSTNIGYKSSIKQSYTFDITTVELRNQIIDSIKFKIEDYEDEIKKYSHLIQIEQDELNQILNQDEVTLESLFLFKDEVLSHSDIEIKVNSINIQIDNLTSIISTNSSSSETNKKLQRQLHFDIIEEMNKVYKKIDSDGNLNFENIFTKNTEVYSGSEQTIYYLVRSIAIANITNHHLPIVIDSYRAEDLSSRKDFAVLELFKEHQQQIILTTTLKNSEVGIYNQLSHINHVDYSSHTPSKILTNIHINKFQEILKKFNITL